MFSPRRDTKLEADGTFFFRSDWRIEAKVMFFFFRLDWCIEEARREKVMRDRRQRPINAVVILFYPIIIIIRDRS